MPRRHFSPPVASCHLNHMAEHAKYISLTPTTLRLPDRARPQRRSDPRRARRRNRKARHDQRDANCRRARHLHGILAGAIGARSAVEVGTFTGYSALCVARALPADGKLLCCDVNEEWTSMGRRYWERAGVANKITLKLAPAGRNAEGIARVAHFRFRLYRRRQNQLRDLLRGNPEAAAPKRPDPDRQCAVERRSRRRTKQDADTQALRKLNDFIAKDTRVEAVMLGIADGLTIVRKK